VTPLVLLLGWLVGAAWGLDQSSVMVPRDPSANQEAPTPADLMRHLAGDDVPDRLLAARDLRRMARRSLKLSNRERGDELVINDALVQLAELDRLAAPTCTALLTAGGVARPCADLLGILETAAALPALHAALPTASRSNRRHIERAIKRIERAQLHP
jgi:hypothetical protein